MDCEEFDNLPSEDSDGDAQVLLEQQIRKLKQENVALVQEAGQLRAQFENAMNITKQLEGIHDKNAKLSATARSLKFERDGMEKRLEIAKKTEGELRRQIEDEKQRCDRAIAEAEMEKGAEVAKLQEKQRAAVEKLKKKLKKASEDKGKGEVKVQQLESQIQRAIQNASEHFAEPVGDIEALIKVLGRPQVKVEAQQSEGVDERVAEVVGAMKVKLKKCKAKLKQHRQNEKSMAQQVAKLQREMEEKERRSQADVEKMAAKLREKEEEWAADKAAEQEKVKMVVMKNESLESEVKCLNGIIKELKDREAELRAKVRPAAPKLVAEIPKADETRELKQKIELLDCKVKDLKRKLKREEGKKKEAIEQQKQAENALVELQMEIKKQACEFDALKVVHNETLGEVQCLRQSVRGTEEKKEHKKGESKEIKRLQAHIDEQELVIKRQVERIEEIVSDLESEREKANKLSKKNEELKVKMEENIRQMEQHETDILISSRQMVNDAKMASENVIPPPAWRYQEFDEELSVEIDKIAGNTLLQPATKLHQVYKVIVNYYNALIREYEETLKHERSELRSIKKIANQFVLDVSLKLGLSTTTLEDIVDDGGSQIIDRIQNIVSQLDQATRESGKLAVISEQLEKTFGPTTDPCSQITQLRKHLEQQCLNVKKTQTKYKALKKKFKSFRQSTVRQLENEAKESDEKSSLISEMKQKQSDNEETIRMLKGELSSLRSAHKELQRLNSERDAHIGGNYEDDIKALKDENEELQKVYNSELVKIRDELNRNIETIAERDAAIVKLKNKLTHVEDELSAKETELSELRDSKDAELKRMRSRDAQAKDTYDRTIGDFKLKCDAYLADLNRITEELATTKKLHEKAKKVITQLKDDNSQLNEQNKTLSASLERERDLNRAAIKSANMEADAKAKEKLQKTKAKFETERRRLFMYAFDEFRTFFNPSDVINERSFRELLLKVRSEIKRLSDSDTIIRRLTGASPQQSTDDAVAKILISAQL